MPAKTLEDLNNLTVEELRSTAFDALGKAQLLANLAGNPETREGLQRLIKKASPSTVIPEIDSKDALRAELGTEREERQKLERRIMEGEARTNVRERREAIKAKFGFSDADVEKVEQMILEHKDENWSHDTAATVFSAQRQSAEPTPATFMPPTFQMPEKEVWAGGIGNPGRLNKIVLDEAARAWNEIASGKVAGLGGARSVN